ncbi:uncharacterized protein [Drosophila takahashii]|uniref:uncharacterized protein n=1 Tax=Drosophila takahashii TaxID=29030 RepID=UPI00389914D1
MERKSLEMVVSGADDEDSSICKAYKLTLSRTCDDWDSVRDMWKKTFNLRQQDVTTLNNLEFFEAWNKFSHAKAFELIDIDFEIIYPGKGFHLLSKWQEFRDKIFGYYEDNISNAQCKTQLTLAKKCTNLDDHDFLIATLFNAVLPSSGRFRNEDGKLTRKATILDAQESFVLRLVTINDFEIQLDRVINKYYSSGLKLQPIIIVVGPFDNDIKDFFLSSHWR